MNEQWFAGKLVWLVGSVQFGDADADSFVPLVLEPRSPEPSVLVFTDEERLDRAMETPVLCRAEDDAGEIGCELCGLELDMPAAGKAALSVNAVCIRVDDGVTEDGMARIFYVSYESTN